LRSTHATHRAEPVAEEAPVGFVYNGFPHAVMVATPTEFEDFAVFESAMRTLARAASSSLEAARGARS
jgi:formate dehydrogenase assembly factor FdhD